MNNSFVCPALIIDSVLTEGNSKKLFLEKKDHWDNGHESSIKENNITTVKNCRDSKVYCIKGKDIKSPFNHSLLVDEADDIQQGDVLMLTELQFKFS